MTPARVIGVSRVFESDRICLLTFDKAPTEEQLRVLHEQLTGVRREHQGLLLFPMVAVAKPVAKPVAKRRVNKGLPV